MRIQFASFKKMDVRKNQILLLYRTVTLLYFVLV